MRLSKAGLPREQGNADRSALNAAEQFQAKTLVDLGKIHL